MASILNNPLCTTKSGNVGVPSCAVSIDHVVGLIVTEDSFELTTAQLATWAATLTALKAACLAPVGQRIYPLHDILGLTDNTPAPEIKTSGYGVTVGLTEKPHSFEIDYKNNGVKFFAELRKFKDRKDLRVFLIEPDHIDGTETSTGIQGFRCSFQAKQVKIGNIADVTKYPIQLDLSDPTCLTDRVSTFNVPSTVTLSSELAGILKVNLATIGSVSATGATVTVVTEISKTNLYDEYSGSTALASTGAWVATNSVSGAVVTITGVTAVAGTKAFTLAYASQTEPVNISLAAPSVLAAAPINVGGNGSAGFESDTVTAPIA